MTSLKNEKAVLEKWRIKYCLFFRNGPILYFVHTPAHNLTNSLIDFTFYQHTYHFLRPNHHLNLLLSATMRCARFRLHCLNIFYFVDFKNQISVIFVDILAFFFCSSKPLHCTSVHIARPWVIIGADWPLSSLPSQISSSMHRQPENEKKVTHTLKWIE